MPEKAGRYAVSAVISVASKHHRTAPVTAHGMGSPSRKAEKTIFNPCQSAIAPPPEKVNVTGVAPTVALVWETTYLLLAAQSQAWGRRARMDVTINRNDRKPPNFSEIAK